MVDLPDSTFPPPIKPELFERIRNIRRDLHEYPELSWEEERTAGKVCEYLDELGIAYQSGIAGHGIVAHLPGKDDSKGAIALRADLDALPIQEETGLPFASKEKGVMHACGHDGHTSILLGAASLLLEEKELPVPVKLIFQPAEETAKGAVAMIEAGVLDGVAMIFGGHIDRHYPLGTIVVTPCPVNASSDRFRIVISGRGGHAARPHETVDAVVVGSLLVMAIQTIVSREVNPAHPSVVTVGTFHAGTAFNVISDRAELCGTIRAQDESVREALHGSIRRIATSVGQLHGAAVDIEIMRGAPAVINPPDMARLCWEAAEQVENATVRGLEVANMGGEDFGFFMQQCRGCYVRFGSVAQGQEPHPAHSSRFDFDERTLGFGAAYFREVVRHASRALLAE